MFALFTRFCLSMTLKDAESVSHQGRCDEDIKAFLHTGKMDRQLKKIPPDEIRDELKEYGAWDKYDLSDDDANSERIVWIAAGNIIEERISRK